MRPKKRTTTILLGFVLSISLVLAACASQALGSIGSGPRAWVGAPREGSELSSGEVSVLCHAFARAGVAEVELLVNGGFAGRSINAQDPGATYVDVEVGFQATQAGSYALQCRTTDQEGATGASEPVTVVVSGDVRLIMEETPTLPVMPASTGEPVESPPATSEPEATSTSTAIPAATATSTSVPAATPSLTPTGTATTAPPPRIVSFEVDRSQIAAGECVVISWRVEDFPTEIYLNGQGVTNPGSADMCLQETTTFTLTAIGPGGEDTESRTVEVTQPPEDTEGPTIQNVSHSPSSADCFQNDTVEISAWVTDPSGVDSVKLYCEASGGGVDQPKKECGSFSKNGGNSWVISYDPDARGLCPGGTAPPVTVEYWIRATDGAPGANVSEWGPGSFQVTS
jgi:hypothetical protein